MLIAMYDSDTDDNDFELQDFKSEIENELKDFKFPTILEAQNSNWRGQTGYTEAENIDETIRKVSSFNSSFIEFHKEDNEYFFRLATHDRPTGFNIYLKEVPDNED